MNKQQKIDKISRIIQDLQFIASKREKYRIDRIRDGLRVANTVLMFNRNRSLWKRIKRVLFYRIRGE